MTVAQIEQQAPGIRAALEREFEKNKSTTGVPPKGSDPKPKAKGKDAKGKDAKGVGKGKEGKGTCWSMSSSPYWHRYGEKDEQC